MFIFSFFFSILSISAVVGIDIGTETIKAGVFRKKNVEIILNEQSKRLTDALVSFETSGNISAENIRNIDRRIGYLANPTLFRNKSAVFRAFPDILGVHESEELKEHLDNRLYGLSMKGNKINGIDPYIPLSMLFKRLIANAQVQFGKENDFTDCVIAVPSFFTEQQRQRVLDASELANLNVLKLIDSKTAAAYTYAHEKLSFFVREPKTVAFVDFGAGCFSITGYKFSATYENKRGVNPRPNPKVEELIHIWDDRIGGIDLDILIAKDIMSKYGIDTINHQLLLDAKKIKHSLTLNDKANETIDVLNKKIIYTREEFYEAAKPIFDKIREITDSINQTFDNVEFIGGSSRIPYIQEIISSKLGNISRSLNQDETVLYGATFLGAMIKNLQKSEMQISTNNVLKVNVSIGDESKILISEGSPSTKTKTARFENSGSNEITLFYSGQVPAGVNRTICKYTIPEKVAKSGGRLTLIFSLNSNGMLQLSKCQNFAKNAQGEQQIIDVDVEQMPRVYILTKEDRDFARQLTEAFRENDERMSRITFAKNEYESVLYNLRANLTDKVFVSVASPEELEKMKEQLEEGIKWTETHHEFEDETELVQRKNDLYESLESVIYRATEKKGRGPAIQELEYLLNEMYEAVMTRWKKQKINVPKQQKKAILTHIRQTRDWLDRMQTEQDDLEEYDDPILKLKDIELRTKKLSLAFKELEEACITKKIKSYRDEDDEDEFGADV